jgi:hypothetical protein
MFWRGKSLNSAKFLGLTVLGLAACAAQSGAQRADTSLREVKVATSEPLRAFARCMAHALDHSRPDLRHVAVPAADGAWEVLSRDYKTMLMVNHLRQAGGPVIIATRLHAASPPARKWHEGVDAGIDECNGGGHPH